MKSEIVVVLCCIFVLLFPSICLSDEVILGKYCYTYGDKESLQEARELTRTLAIRNAIESYRVYLTSTTTVVNFALTNDILQVITSGYLKNIKIVEHKEDGRTICDTVQADVSPAEIEKILKQEVKNRTTRIEAEGIDSNEYLKILSVRGYKEAPYVTVRALKDLPRGDPYLRRKCEDNQQLYIYVDYYDKDGTPMKGERMAVCGLFSGEIRQFVFHGGYGAASNKAWLKKGGWW